VIEDTAGWLRVLRLHVSDDPARDSVRHSARLLNINVDRFRNTLRRLKRPHGRLL
jgi:hypothetical protein